ncbi:MAG: translocation/assembly module TamB, partial [Bacteroidetes bacterium]|nr:translocation/assembly module TamB [Bacteroidota bacterium]
NYIPVEVSSNQYIDYNFQIYNKIIDVFVPDLQFGDNTRIKGSVYSDDTKFKLDFRSPEMLIYNNYLGKINLQVDNNNPLFNTYISIDSLHNGYYNLKDVNLINKTLSDTLYIQSTFSGGKEKEDLFDLSLYHTIDSEGNSVVGIKKSTITYKENLWYLNKNNNNLNKIVFDNEFKSIQFDSILLSHNDEYIQFAGSVNDSTHKNLHVKFKDVQIANITPQIDSLALKGNVNGQLNVIQKQGLYYPNSTIKIDNIYVNEVNYGHLDLKLLGNNNLTFYDIVASLTHENVKSIDAVGNIDVSQEDPQIQLNVNLNDLNLMAISPFGGGVISNIRGFIFGRAQITGNLKAPDVLGNFVLKESGLRVPYLNVDFDLDDQTNIIVTRDKLKILSTQITDTKHNTKGILSGNATHKNFEDWKLNLNITTDNLIVLDTKIDEEKLFYGTAFISGEAGISGPIDELVIDVVAATEKNTSFKIPLSDTESIGDDSFIKFLSPKEKAARLRGEKVITKDLTGLTLNFELDINRNAEVEIVIDQINKSAIRGRGAGTLLLEINTLGKFNMWGDFIVYEGFYDFRYGKIIKKEIEVERDGTITWDGVPGKAELNLKAVYKTKANPSALLDDPTINRKIPVEVIIDLTEDISQPELIFDIAFPEVSSTVRSELEYKLQTQEERETQALFLITTDSFINDAAGQNALSGTLTGGINAILAQMLSDEDALINIAPYYDMGIDTVELETEDEIGVQFSSQLSERIIVNGKVGIPVGGINDSRVAGDVEVQWLVNEDGNLRVKFFNRQAELQFIGEDQTFEQGAGISYSVDFDTLKELIKKIFGTDIELESSVDDAIPDDNSAPVNFKSVKKIEEN